ncbi:hypothetical protein NA57DRAFT_72718 [Rhizodiscina lignyota]|uniref:Mitochondrial inner-membrane-bound regulator-domain-containing protein n=1 Tax=Rhizodiscina lignyota TaxID=1504668 RepID=A0A9P4M825_9PEZI|nr:hypothetical protein NA57DRAFT_72718 [Rhizodiscina lignyota]
MLNAPRSLGASICLQCQFRIWRRTLAASKTHPKRFRVSSHNSLFSTTAYHNDSAERQDVLETKATIHRSSFTKKFKVLYPHGRIRGRRGKEVVEDSAPLDIESLGEPSEIIVLKEADFDEPQKQEKGNRTDSEPSTVGAKDDHASVSTEEILRSIKDDTTAPSQDAVNKHLDTLRSQMSPRDVASSKTLSWAEYVTLRSKIFESYSAKQLLGYTTYIQKKTSRGKDTHAASRANKKELRIVRSQWVPGRSSWTHRLPLEDTGKEKMLLSKKAVLVDVVLRSYWNIEVENEFGQLELRGQRWQLELLNAGEAPTIPNEISERHQVYIDSARDPNLTVLRINGSRKAAQAAADEIESILANAATETLSIHLASKWLEAYKDFLPDTLSNSKIRNAIAPFRASFTSSKQLAGKITIYGLSETDMQDARRAILNLLPLHRGTVMNELVHTGEPTVDLPKMAIEREFLPYYAREWEYRDAMQSTGVERPDPQLLKDRATLDSEDLTRFHDLLMSECSYEKPSKVDPFSAWKEWENSPDTVVSARLGRAVTLRNSPSGPGSSTETSQIHGIHSQFLQSVPYQFRLLSFLEDHQRDSGREIERPSTRELIFHYIPSPWAEVSQEGFRPERFPTVQVNFASTQLDETPRFADVSAELMNDNFDVSLRGIPSDVRFTKRVSLMLKRATLRPFITAIEDSIAAGEVLRAPESVGLHVPLSLRRRLDTSRIPNPQHEWDAGYKEQVPYLFAGVEHKQTAHFEFHGFPLQYIMVEGGRTGGRRSEVVLECSPAILEEIKKTHMPDDSRKFFDAAVELAYLNARAASGSLEDMKGTESSHS